MSTPLPSIATQGAGFGLGLRTEHYADFLAGPQPLDWLEIITDNFLVEGGKPLVMLDTLRRDYPMAMHGVAMSLGAPGGVDMGYLKRVKALAARIEPLWVSDHLCWTGAGPKQLHDLYPLPYTDEAARHVIIQIRRAQDVLGRRLVLENVSSYIAFKSSAVAEWQFLSHIAQAADCLLLVDVNNIYVSSVNHGFDPLDYLRGLPAQRVQQIHLAGHSDNGTHIVDTHDHPVASPVWALYGQACALWGTVPAMIERDAHIPPLAELLDEMALARRIATQPGAFDFASAGAGAHAHAHASLGMTAQPRPAQGLKPATPAIADTLSAAATATSGPNGLVPLQQALTRFVLSEPPSTEALTAKAFTAVGEVSAAQADGWPERMALSPLLSEDTDWSRHDRLGVYHHAYRARLAEVLGEGLAKTQLYMGSDVFETHARAYAVAHPPTQRGLNRYGAGFPDFLGKVYPANPELLELAQLDWDLRACFDGPDSPALDAATAAANASMDWLSHPNPLHPSVRVRPIATNVVQLWKAMDDDADVPPPQALDAPAWLVVWRKGLQPHFQTVDAEQAQALCQLGGGVSIQGVAQGLLQGQANGQTQADPQRLATWLQAWLHNGWLTMA